MMKILVTVFSLISLFFFISQQAKADSPIFEIVSHKYLQSNLNNHVKNNLKGDAQFELTSKSKKIVDLSIYEINNGQLFLLKAFNIKTNHKSKKRIIMLAKVL